MYKVTLSVNKVYMVYTFKVLWKKYLRYIVIYLIKFIEGIWTQDLCRCYVEKMSKPLSPLSLPDFESYILAGFTTAILMLNFLGE